LLWAYFKKCDIKVFTDAIIDTKDWNQSFVPLSIKKKFVSIREVNWKEGAFLNINDIIFLFHIVKQHPLSGWFLLKICIKIAKYSYIIRQYHPKAIIVHNEYSFTSSVLTDYCRKKGVSHINFMHGEKLYNIRDSFFEYDDIYIWDEHYLELFLKLRAKIVNYHIELPPALIINESKEICQGNCFYDAKYYTAYYTESEIKQISEILNRIEKKGLSCCVRLHPIYSDIKLAQKYLRKEQIEDIHINIGKSISNCCYVIGCFSTVLLQGYYANKKIILDDVVYNDILKKLQDRDYLMLSKKHLLLSNFI